MNSLKRVVSIGIAVAFAAALTACEKPGPAETAGKKIDATTEKAEQKIEKATEKADKLVDDAAITTKVKAAILAEPGLSSLQISVDTMDGEVTLAGSVDSQQNIDRAKEVAKAVVGVKKVDNQLVLMSPK